MGFWSKVREFGREMFSTPESKINELVSVIVSACKKELSDAESIQILKQAAQKHFTPEAHAQLLLHRLRDAKREESETEVQSIYIVAIGDSILNLMGEDTMSHSQRSFLTDEQNEQARRSCELQRTRINFANLDQETVWDALWQSFGIKAAWKSFDHPCWKMCRITDIEVWARDEWNKAHPMPD